MPRRKSESLQLPADRAEAELMIGEYTAIERDRLLEELAADEAISMIKSKLAERRGELDAQAKPLFEALRAWWQGDGNDTIAKGRRSAELGSATIGVRLTPPALKTERKVTFADVLAWLRTLRWARAKDFLRIKVELDKDAIGKAMRSEPDIAKKFAGKLRIVQSDEFFIDTGLDAESVQKETTAAS